MNVAKAVVDVPESETVVDISVFDGDYLTSIYVTGKSLERNPHPRLSVEICLWRTETTVLADVRGVKAQDAVSGCVEDVPFDEIEPVADNYVCPVADLVHDIRWKSAPGTVLDRFDVADVRIVEHGDVFDRDALFGGVREAELFGEFPFCDDARPPPFPLENVTEQSECGEADGVVDRVRDQIRIVRFTACIVDNDHRNLDAGFLNGGDQRVDLIVCKVRFRQDTHQTRRVR
ncbi:hypothetical protein LQ367_16290 [Halorubrum lacusprofundi]|nr:hypothetical protein [Halorubrum lacusprofundi]MCG1008134.1 hypothetical protein [Halorubrum lacusprofundi]